MSILNDLITAVFNPVRQIGPYSSPVTSVPPLEPFSAQVTIKEVHIDRLSITKHPVEYGAAISDHAYKEPCNLMVQLGWSNSGLQSAIDSIVGLAAVVTGDQGGDFNYMQTVYNKLLILQEARIPFDITTGKRKYNNMLISSLQVETEDKTEHALFVTMYLEQIIIVTTQAITSTAANVQTNPQSNAPTVSSGPQKLAITSQPVPDYISVKEAILGN